MAMLVITRWFVCVSISSIAGQCWSWLGNSVQCLRKTCWSKPLVEASFWCTLQHSRPWLQSMHQQHEHLGLGELDDSRAVFWWLSMAKLFQDMRKIQNENFVGFAECLEFGNLFQLCHGNCAMATVKTGRSKCPACSQTPSVLHRMLPANVPKCKLSLADSHPTSPNREPAPEMCGRVKMFIIYDQ